MRQADDQQPAMFDPSALANAGQYVCVCSHGSISIVQELQPFLGAAE
jgi:hypothetical protein